MPWGWDCRELHGNQPPILRGAGRSWMNPFLAAYALIGYADTEDQFEDGRGCSATPMAVFVEGRKPNVKRCRFSSG